MKRTYSRITALIAGTVVLLINGLVYSWSIYSGPFSEQFGWTSAVLGLCFTVILGSFCLGGLIGGIITAKKGIGFSIPLGGLMSSLGFCLCVLLNADRLALLYVNFCIAGLGVGIVYNAILGAVVCRFPDKKGTASGVMLMGYGAGSLVIGSVAAVLIASPLGWKATYLLTGGLLLAAALIGRIFLRVPETEPHDAQTAPQEGMTPGQMVRTRTFWLFFVIAIIGSAFGAGIIGHARYIALEAGAAASLATLAVGLVSVMNGLGRVVIGSLHDKYNFLAALFCDAAIYIVCGITAYFSLRSGLTWGTLVAMMLCGFAYGGVPTLSSAVTGEFFGPTHYGKNLGILNLNILPGAFAATVAGAIETSTGSYAGAFALFLIMEAAAVILMAVLGRVRKSAETTLF